MRKIGKEHLHKRKTFYCNEKNHFQSLVKGTFFMNSPSHFHQIRTELLRWGIVYLEELPGVKGIRWRWVFWWNQKRECVLPTASWSTRILCRYAPTAPSEVNNERGARQWSVSGHRGARGWRTVNNPCLEATLFIDSNAVSREFAVRSLRMTGTLLTSVEDSHWNVQTWSVRGLCLARCGLCQQILLCGGDGAR